MAERSLEWRIEDTCLRAWPALRTVEQGDWLARFGDGLTRRANSANPRRGRLTDLDADIVACERLYLARGMPPVFRIPSLVEGRADTRLNLLGYGVEGGSLIQFAAIEDVASEAGAKVELAPDPDPSWLAAQGLLQGRTAKQDQVYARIVGSIAVPAMFAALEVDGGTVSAAYAALHDDLLCYESVVTDVRHRGRGHARAVLMALTDWGRQRGARGVCLQVEATNASALNLYRGLGMTNELYRYHYRRAPQQR